MKEDKRSFKIHVETILQKKEKIWQIGHSVFEFKNEWSKQKKQVMWLWMNENKLNGKIPNLKLKKQSHPIKL